MEFLLEQIFSYQDLLYYNGMCTIRHRWWFPTMKCCFVHSFYSFKQQKKPSDNYFYRQNFQLATLVGWLCWGLTSQSTIFQSYRDGAIASWVINQYFGGVKCLAQGHNTAAVGLEPRTSRSGVRHSTTEPRRSPHFRSNKTILITSLCMIKFSNPITHFVQLYTAYMY